MVKDIELIEGLLADYFHSERRLVENSGVITPSWYVKEEARIQKEQNEAYAAMSRIIEKLGVE